jgi:hypothetical protein
VRRSLTFLFLLALSCALAATASTLATGAPQTLLLEPDPLPCPATGTRLAATAVERDREAANVEVTGSVVVSPAAVETDAALAPRSQFTCTITIRNRRDATTTFKLVPTGAIGSDTDGGVEFIDADDPRAGRTAASWISPLVDEVSISSLGIARVPVRLVVPADPPPGSAYATLDVVPQVPVEVEGAGGAAVGIESRLQVAFLLQTTAEGMPRLVLRDTDAPRLRWNRDSWTFRATVANDGTSFAKPSGRVRIRSIFGSTVATLPVQTRPLLPSAARPMTPTWTGVPWFGFYRYDVRVTSGADDRAGSEPVRHAGWFIALPPWWLVALVGAALLYLLLRWLIPRVRRNLPEHRDDSPEGPWSDFSGLP